MQNLKPNNNFKALYNPFIRKLAVLYGDTVSTYTFSDVEEWTKVSFNGDENHPNYLHIQIDYDECFQLLFYPRVDNNNSLHESLGKYFNSSRMNDIPECITLIYSEYEWQNKYNELLKDHKEIILNHGY